MVVGRKFVARVRSINRFQFLVNIQILISKYSRYFANVCILNVEIFASTLALTSELCNASSGICYHQQRLAMCKKSTGWLFQPTRPHVLELTVADRTDGPDVRLPSFSGCPRLSRYSLSCLSLHRTAKEETSCGSGSIFRVRRCNKKQSSQRGVDIADGTDGHVAFVESTIASQPYCTTPRPFLYLFLRRLRFRFIVTTRPNGICISKFVNC